MTTSAANAASPSRATPLARRFNLGTVFEDTKRASLLTFVVVFVAVFCAAPERLVPARYPPELGGGWVPNNGYLLAPAPSGTQGAVTFIVHTQCKSDEVRTKYANYWLDGQKEMYIVRHNYKTKRFFEPADAIKMDRVILPGEERAYRVTTDQVDWEFGFAYKNLLTGEWLYEIGELGEAPLQQGQCTQRYGKYFNRIMTREEPGDIEYMWGSCEKTCSAASADSAYTVLDPTGEIPACDNNNPYSGLTLGEGDDARLVQLRSGMMAEVASVSKLSGRALISRDPYYSGESENMAQHVMSLVNPYPSNPLKMLLLRVSKDESNVLRLCRGAGRAWNTMPNINTNCAGIDCAAARYDGPLLYRDSDSYDYDVVRASRILYTIGLKGGGRAEEFQQVYSDEQYLTAAGNTLFAKGSWGDDLDARRLVITSGAPCGSNFWGNRCVRMLACHRRPGGTANEVYWLGGSFNGATVYIVRMKAFVQDGALKLAGVDARIGRHTCTWSASTVPGQFTFDALDTSCCDMNALWDGASPTTLATSFDQAGFGVGAVKFNLAPEMVQSLA